MRQTIPFIGGSDEYVSVNRSANRTINWHVEPNAQGQLGFVSTPGTVLKVTAGTGPIRGAYPTAEYLYVASGNELYKISTLYVATLVGSLSTSTGPVTFDADTNTLVLVDGPYGYAVTLATGAFTQITDPDFSGGSHVAFQGNRILVAGDEDGKFRASGLINATDYDSLDFATAEYQPDDILAMIVDNNQVVLLNEITLEIWRNVGGSGFPYQVMEGSQKDVGIIARHSLATLDNTSYWLARDKDGFKGIARLNNYTPEVVSSDTVTDEINGYAVKDDAIGFAYTKGRRNFYVLTFPTENKTWVFDPSIPDPKLAWHEWSSYEIGRFRGNCHAYFNGLHFVGDYANGNIYQLDWNTYTDNSGPLISERYFTLSANKGLIMRLFGLEAYFEAGLGQVSGQDVDPQAMLRISRDGGKNYGSVLTRSMGLIGDYAERTRWNGLGGARNWVLHLSVSAGIARRLIDVYADLAINSH